MPVVLGTSGNDSLVGTAGSDTVVGFAGDDTIDDGGGGPDELAGGTGNDIYVVTDARNTIVENVGEGTDTVRTALAAYVLATNVENLTFTGTGAFNGRGNASINTIIGGAGNDFLFGFDGRDVLVGQAGDDWLDGGTGIPNQLQGGTGNDTYISDAAGDTIVEFTGEGTDTVRTSLASFLLATNLENLIFTGNGAFYGTGNAAENVMIGGAGNDFLFGMDGRDVLVGDGGDDWLDGGSGVGNQVQGGVGNDTYIVSSVGDTLIEFTNEGVDTVRTSLDSYTLATNFERLVYTGSAVFTGMGNAADNVIVGGVMGDTLYGYDGRDVLVGGDGRDFLYGGTGAANELYGGVGDDIYYVEAAGDTIIEFTNEGRDEILTSLATFTIPANVEDLTVTATGAVRITGNALGNRILSSGSTNVIDGGDGDDFIAPTATTSTNNRFFGGEGNDRIGTFSTDVADGGNGDDVLSGSGTLIGGPGNDSYGAITSQTVIVEQPGGGIDTLVGSGQDNRTAYTLPANVENFTWLFGPSGISVTGNADGNVIDLQEIVSGAVSNTLSGADGNDALIGALSGTNIFIGGNGSDYMQTRLFIRTVDHFRYLGGETGVDTISGFVSGEDKIALSSTGFARTAVLGFVQTPNPQAVDPVSTFLYDQGTGALSYDPDGSGPAAAIALAVLDNRPVLALSDFIFF